MITDGTDPKDRLEEKEIVYSSTERIDAFLYLADDFIEKVLDAEPYGYFISDKSELSDFLDMDARDTAPFWARIEEIYGLSKSDVNSERLLDIFAEIARRTEPH
jgi:hypothetical protein